MELFEKKSANERRRRCKFCKSAARCYETASLRDGVRNRAWKWPTRSSKSRWIDSSARGSFALSLHSERVKCRQNTRTIATDASSIRLCVRSTWHRSLLHRESSNVNYSPKLLSTKWPILQIYLLEKIDRVVLISIILACIYKFPRKFFTPGGISSFLVFSLFSPKGNMQCIFIIISWKNCVLVKSRCQNYRLLKQRLSLWN